MVITRRFSEYAVGGLIAVVVTQALGYGLIFDLNFFLRNLSVMGGLIMVLSDSWVRKTVNFAGLPQLEEKDRKMYFQLAGRVLLIFLFIGFVFAGEWSIWRVMVSIIGLIACVMVVVGFKAKFSATLLVVILSIFNLFVNNFWTVSWDSKAASAELLLQSFHLLTCHYLYPASRAPPPQGLCQVRLLPDPLDRWWSASARQQRPWPVQYRREEEGILKEIKTTHHAIEPVGKVGGEFCGDLVHLYYFSRTRFRGGAGLLRRWGSVSPDWIFAAGV